MTLRAGLLARGSALRTFEFFSTALVSLGLTPLIISSLGESMYGMWIFIVSFIGYYSLLDFGMSAAVERFLSRAIGSGENEKAERVISTALVIFSALGLAALLAAFAAAWAVPAIISNITDAALFRSLALILGLNFAVGLPLRVYQGVLSANLRHDISAVINLVKLLARTILIVYCLRSGYGIVSLALITGFVDVAGYIASFIAVKSLYGYVRVSRKSVDRSLVRQLLGYSGYSFIYQTTEQMRFGADNLVIAAFIGLPAVALYSIASRLVRYFMLLMMSALNVLTPVFSRYEATGDYDSIREKFILATKISSYLAILVGGLLIIFGEAFIARWVGPAFSGAYPALVVLVIPFVIDIMQSPSVQVLFGISKHRGFTLINLFEGSANLILSLLLVRRFGIMGVAYGTAVPMLIVKLFIQPAYTCRAIKLDLRKYYLGVLLPAAVNSGVILAAFWYIARNFIIADYAILVFLIAAAVIIFSVAVFFTGFRYVERSYFKELILGAYK